MASPASRSPGPVPDRAKTDANRPDPTHPTAVASTRAVHNLTNHQRTRRPPPQPASSSRPRPASRPPRRTGTAGPAGRFATGSRWRSLHLVTLVRGHGLERAAPCSGGPRRPRRTRPCDRRGDDVDLAHPGATAAPGSRTRVCRSSAAGHCPFRRQGRLVLVMRGVGATRAPEVGLDGWADRIGQNPRQRAVVDRATVGSPSWWVTPAGSRWNFTA